jgi:GTP1/Obg family GTP-binding protein
VEIVEIVDSELIKDKEYASMGKNPADRVKTLLGKLDSVRASKERGSRVSTPSEQLFHKFVEQLKEIFKNLPKPLELRSFYNNGLPILMDINEEVREVSNQNHLNRAQTRALKKLKDVSPEEFQRVTANGEESSKTVIESDSKKSTQIDLKDLSGREIDPASVLHSDRSRP